VAAVGPAGAGQVLAAVAATTPNTSKRDAAAPLVAPCRRFACGEQLADRVRDSGAGRTTQAPCAPWQIRHRSAVHRSSHRHSALEQSRSRLELNN